MLCKIYNIAIDTACMIVVYAEISPDMLTKLFKLCILYTYSSN